MGARMYFIKRENGKWKAIYSHWGADIIKGLASNKDVIKTVYEGNHEKFNEILNKTVKELIDEELNRPDSIISYSNNLKGLIDLKDICIEAYFIDNNKSKFLIYVFISEEVNGCVLTEIKTAHDLISLTRIYRKYKSFIDVASESLEADVIKKMLLRYHLKYNNDKAMLFFDGEKIFDSVLKLIEQQQEIRQVVYF